MEYCKTLEELLAFLKTLTCDCGNCDECNIDMSSLPIFSNDCIDCVGVWSFDDTHMITGECSQNFKIVERDYFTD